MIHIKKRILIIFYLLLILILISISRGFTYNKKNIQNNYKKVTHYKNKNLSRYKKYHSLHQDLSFEQIITHVNLGLDYPYYTNTKKANSKDNNLILVNKYNYLEKDYIPNNLTKINQKYSTKSLLLQKQAQNSFEKMAEAASQENLTILAASTYRSYSYQESLYNKYKFIDGEKADTYSARPGYSEHQTGLAVDVCTKSTSYENFINTKEFIWMKKNSYKYGFIMRYPESKTFETGYTYEPWHYRYLGIDIAIKVHKSNLSYDEYYTIYLNKK